MNRSRRSRSTETLRQRKVNIRNKCHEISNCCPGPQSLAYNHSQYNFLPPGAGPVGVIEKILEYRPLQQSLPHQQQLNSQWLPPGWSGIELRRIAPSADGLIEYRQVIGPEVAFSQQAYLGLFSSASAGKLMAPPTGWQEKAAAPNAAEGIPKHRQSHRQLPAERNIEPQRVRRNGSFPDLARSSKEDLAMEMDLRPHRDRRRHVHMQADPSATYPYSSHASRHQQTLATPQHIHHIHHHHHVPKPEEYFLHPDQPEKELQSQRHFELQRELQRELQHELEHRRRSKSASSVIRDSGQNDYPAQPIAPKKLHASQEKSPSVHSKLSFQVTSRPDYNPSQDIHTVVAAKTRAKSKLSRNEEFQTLPSSETLPPPFEFDGKAIALPQHICGLEKEPEHHQRSKRDRSRDTLRSETTSAERLKDQRPQDDQEKVKTQHKDQERRARRDHHEKERLEHDRKERMRFEKEKLEKERQDHERREHERRHREKLERERHEQSEKLLLIEAERKEKERREHEILEHKKQLEHERQVREYLEHERVQREIEKKEREHQEKEKREKIEREKLERLRHEKREKERLEQEKREKEQERIRREIEHQRREKERLEKEKREWERRERERLEFERRERERKEKERQEKERQERERRERERQERERERQEQERLEQERKEQERRELERQEQLRLEAERLKLEREERERIKQEKRERAKRELERQLEEERKKEIERRERERIVEIERKEQERIREIEKKKKEQEQLRRDRDEREKRERARKEEREKQIQRENELRDLDEFQKMKKEMEERDRRIALRAMEKHKEAKERAKIEQIMRDQEEKEKLAKEMAEKEKVAKMMAEKERHAEKLKREAKFGNLGKRDLPIDTYVEGDTIDDIDAMSPGKVSTSWDRRSRKSIDSIRLIDEKKYSKRPASSGQVVESHGRQSLERRARSDDHRYRASREDLRDQHSPSISPPCTCDMDSEGESHKQETIREVPTATSPVFSPPKRYSRDGKIDVTSWDRKSGRESRSTMRTVSRSHGRASQTSSAAYVIEAETRAATAMEDEKRYLVSTPKATPSRSRSRAREHRRGSSGGHLGSSDRRSGRPRSHSGGPDHHILHYPHHFDGLCEVHDADGRRSTYEYHHYGSYADFKCISPEHVTNGRMPHPGLNGSSKSLTSTHPMLTRGASTDRFSALEPRDYEEETLSRKTNIIILRGLKFRRQHWFFMGCVVLLLVFALALGISLSRGSGGNLSQSPELRDAAVAKLLTEVPLIDGHNDLPWNIRKFVHNKLESVNFTENLKLVEPWSKSKWSHTDLLRLTQGKVGCQLWVAYAPCGAQHKDAVQVTLEQIDLIKRFIEAYPKQLQLVKTAQELEDAHAAGKIASLITVESGHSIGTSLAVLRMFHRLGARSLTLTHNCNTPWADCSKVDIPGNEAEHNGLTQFGRTVVEEMNRLGMLVDLSHSSLQTARDTLSVSDAPVIFSHSSAQAICNSSRNVPDNLLRLVAEKKGLVMVNFFSYFLTCSNHSTINDVIAHLNHIRKVAGIDHVGIGASYDGINSTPSGLEDVSKYPALFASLLASGAWSLEDLKKLAGLNFLRVFKEVEKVSRDYYKQKPSENVIPGKDLGDQTECKTEYK